MRLTSSSMRRYLPSAITNGVLQDTMAHFDSLLKEELKAERSDKRQQYLQDLAKNGGVNKTVKRWLRGQKFATTMAVPSRPPMR